jgi:GNAT superfamily N-acetyltransferase
VEPLLISPDGTIVVVPANQATCDDLDAIFGLKGYPARCRCQRFRTTGEEWWHDPIPVEERIFRLHQQADCGYPDSGHTSGVVAFSNDEPAGWCAVDQRSQHIRLGQTPWKGRDEDPRDDGVWAITCLVVRVGFRGQGLTYLLARAAVEQARRQGARALEGYPMVVDPGQKVTWGEIHVGHRRVFAAAGLEQVSHPSKRRVVMRIDF